jgi:dolichol-phosphate mannosyltransferase
MKLSIIAPCYNEVENVTKLHDELLPVVEALVLHGWENAPEKVQAAEIIFVDDGSRDGTSAKLQEVFGSQPQAGVSFKFIQHATNLGLGAAIRTGFKQADGDWVITVDSDGTYQFTTIPALLACLVPGVDLVTASPYHPQGNVVGVPANRLIFSRGSSLIYRWLVDWHLYTYTCLFRAYRAEVIQNIRFEANDFLAGTEILVKAILSGYHAAEFPAVLYRRMYGVSKARIAQTILSHLRFQGWVLLQRLRMLFGFKFKPTK